MDLYLDESVEGTRIKMITENTDDIYEQTIVEVIPLGHAKSRAETMADESGTVRLELVNEKGNQTENE